MPKIKSRKRPCKVCRRWFLPDVRQGKRQKTCARSECQNEWHRRQCAQWNKKNKPYFKANYLKKKIGQINTPVHGPGSVTRSHPPPEPRIKLHLPRQDIQDIIGPQLLVIIEYIIEQIIRRQRLRL